MPASAQQQCVGCPEDISSTEEGAELGTANGEMRVDRPRHTYMLGDGDAHLTALL